MLKDNQMLPNYLDNICETWEPVGSRVTCSPPPTDTDQDILVLLTEEQWPTFLQELEANHWEKCMGKSVDPGPMPLASDFPNNLTGYSQAIQAWDAECDKLDSYSDIGDGATFEAWRLGELNVILTMDEFWFDKFMEASDCCKALNVMDKQERIAIFKRIVPASKPPVKKSPVIWTQAMAQNVHNTIALNSITQGDSISWNETVYTIQTTYDF